MYRITDLRLWILIGYPVSRIRLIIKRLASKECRLPVATKFVPLKTSKLLGGNMTGWYIVATPEACRNFIYFALSQLGVFSLKIGLQSILRNPAQNVRFSLDSTLISASPTRDTLK